MHIDTPTKDTEMKRFALLLVGLFFGLALMAQRPATYTFKGTVSNIPGIQPSAPVTFTIDNTSGNFTFRSEGNGHEVGGFFWGGNMPSVKSQDVASAGANWSFQITQWSDMSVAAQDAKTKRISSVTIRSAKGQASGYGSSQDGGKTVTLQIRIPYDLGNGAVSVPFTVTLQIGNGNKQTGRSYSSDGGVPMPTGTTNDVDIDYENGITVGIVGGGSGTTRASVGPVSFKLPAGYTSKSRKNLGGGGESIQINRNNSKDNLYVEVQSEGLSNVRNLNSDQVAQLLAVRVQYLNTVMPGVQMTGDPKIYFDNNADGYYHQHAYSYGKGKDANGRTVEVYTEATLVNKQKITAGMVIAADKNEFNALNDIYVDVVNAAAGK